MNGSRRLLPHPLLSLLLLVCWLWLNNTLAAGHVLVGAALGVGIPYVTRRFWTEPLQIRHPLRVIEYMVVVIYDVIVANLQVALIIVGPLSRLRPAIVRVPLDLRTDFAVVALASTVTLTPGTVSVEIEDDGAGRRVLLVHALRCLDPDALARTIKQRYERRLKEILEC
jgi:multicomponent K+:H+ antiporter subunit E